MAGWALSGQEEGSLCAPPHPKLQPCPTPALPPAAGAKHVRVWSLSAGFPCLASHQVADLRGSAKAIAVGVGGRVYVGGQSCQVSAYCLGPELLGSADAGADSDLQDGEETPRTGHRVPPLAPASYTAPGSGPPRRARVVGPCGGLIADSIRAVVGIAQPPAAASAPEHSHCGSITALAVCGPYVFSASTDSTVRVWRAGTLEFVKTLRGHRGSVLALYGGPGIVLRWVARL